MESAQAWNSRSLKRGKWAIRRIEGERNGVIHEFAATAQVLTFHSQFTAESVSNAYEVPSRLLCAHQGMLSLPSKRSRHGSDP